MALTSNKPLEKDSKRPYTENHFKNLVGNPSNSSPLKLKSKQEIMILIKATKRLI